VQKGLVCKIYLNRIFSIFVIMLIVGFTINLNTAYAEENETIEIDVKYTNGDIADFNSMKILVYQDFQKEPILEKKLISNPDFISVSENHRYKIGVQGRRSQAVFKTKAK